MGSMDEQAPPGSFIVNARGEVRTAGVNAGDKPKLPTEQEAGGWSERRKKDSYGNVAYGKLRGWLERGEDDEHKKFGAEQIAEMRTSVRMRVAEAEEMLALDSATATLTSRLGAQADRSNYQRVIEQVAVSLEGEADGMPVYRDNEYVNGVVGDVVRATRLLAERDVLRNPRPGPVTPQELTRLREIEVELGERDKNVLWKPEVDWVGVVDQETDQQREERTEAEKMAFQAEMQRLALEAMSGREGTTSIIPRSIVAVFRQGKLGIFEKSWKGRVEFLDLMKDEDRKRWCLKNIGAYSKGAIPGHWKAVIDEWGAEFTDTIDSSGVDLRTRKEIEKTAEDLKAMMAITASAAAMVRSGGDPATYVGDLTGNPKGDLGKQDEWQAYLLHKSPEKLMRVVSDPLVGHYYKKLLDDAGIDVTWECGEAVYEERMRAGGQVTVVRHKVYMDEGRYYYNDGAGRQREIEEEKVGRIKVSEFQVNKVKARSSDLVRYLRSKGAGEYKGGFNQYIDNVLLGAGEENYDPADVEKGKDDLTRWSAAKLACDAFLAEGKFTRMEWETSKFFEDEDLRAGVRNQTYGYTEEGRKYRRDDPWMLLPDRGWGGDPLRGVLEPSFLTRWIKRMYSGENRVILDMVDAAFRPAGLWTKEGMEPIPASMATHLKNLSRWGTALGDFLGDSMGTGIPVLSEKMMGETLPGIAKLLDQAFGNKEVTGEAMAQLILCKATAATMMADKSGLKESLKLLFNPTGDAKDVGARPFLGVEKWLAGPDLDWRSGFIATLEHGGENLVFNERAREMLRKAKDILAMGDEDPKTVAQRKTVQRAGKGLQILAILGETFGKR